MSLLTRACDPSGLSNASEPDGNDVCIRHKGNETNCGAAVGAQDRILLVPLIGCPKRPSRGRLAKQAGNTAATRSQRFDCMLYLFFRRYGRPPTLPIAAAGQRYTRGAGAYEKEQKVGAR